MVVFSFLIAFSCNTRRWHIKDTSFKIIDFVITFILQIFFFCFWEYLFGNQNYNNYLAWGCVLFIHLFFYIKDDFFNKLAKSLVIYVYIILLPQISANANSLLKYHMETNFNILSIIIALSTCSIILILFVITDSNKKQRNFSSFIILLFNLAFSIIIIVTDSQERNYLDNIRSHFFIYVLLLVLSMIAYYLYSAVNMYYSSAYENDVLLLKYESDKRIIDVSKENLEELRRLRHDMKNQYQFMKKLVDEQNIEEFKKYFYEMRENQSKSMINTNNSIIDLILYEENKYLKHQNINVLFSYSNLDKCELSKEELNTIMSKISNDLILSYDKKSYKDVSIDLSVSNETLLIRLSYPIKSEYNDYYSNKNNKNLLDQQIENGIIFITLAY